jgi:hypothetical protein
VGPVTSNPPAVSVIMTAFNREAYIAEAIESVLVQTFPDFELIVADDASTDRTLAIAREYEARDRRVRVVVNERNLGQFPNRNYAASLARGRFLKFHDSDDLLYPHCLDIMVSLLEAEPAAGLGLTAGPGWPGGPTPILSTPRMNYQREFLGYGMFMCGPDCAIFRTEVFQRLGGFPTDVGPAGDYVFWLRACAQHAVVLCPGDLFWYRVHAGQELRSPSAAREYARMGGFGWRALAAPGCPLEPGERELAKRNLAFNIAKQVWRDVRRSDVRLAAYRLRHSGLGPVDWMRRLRPPRRSGLAGTPLDPRGECVVPAWMRLPNAPTTRVGDQDLLP